MARFQFRMMWHSLGWSWHQAAERSRRVGRHTKKPRLPFRLEQLESRAMLSVVNLNGTAGNDVITFQQADATHDTFTLNGTPNTFSTVGVTQIIINSGAGTDSITFLSNDPSILLSASGTGSVTFFLNSTQGSETSLTGGSGQRFQNHRSQRSEYMEHLVRECRQRERSPVFEHPKPHGRNG